MATPSLDHEHDQPTSYAPVIKPFNKGHRAATLDSGANNVRQRFKDIVNTVPIHRENTYKHQKIDYHNDIRILRIQRGNPEDKLQCMLFPSALAPTNGRKAYKYWALSYWWGEPTEAPSNKITIYYDTGARGVNQELTPLNRHGTFYVRNNLKAALIRFRNPKHDVNIWVDALCINQENKIEKNAQVARMHEVYTQAENVCVWLGEGKEHTSETFEFLGEILNLHKLDQLVGKPTPTARKWAMVVELMTNRWFSRRWVIQELALARRASVRWGDKELKWSDFADAIALFMTKYEEIKRTSLDPADHHTAMDARALGANIIVHATMNLFRKSAEGRVEQRLIDLEILVSSLLIAFEASEPRDTIFAVLTLARDSQFVFSGTDGKRGDPRISPDYEKSLLDVYTDFMDYCMERSGSLDILCRYWAPLPRQPPIREALRTEQSRLPKGDKMPTWIPAISKSAFGEPHGVLGGRLNGDSFVGGPERKGQQTYNASAHLKAWWQFGTSSEQQPGGIVRRASTFTGSKRGGQGKLFSNGKQDSQNSEETTPGGIPNVRAEDASKPSGERVDKYDGTLSVKGFILDTVYDVSGRVIGKGVIPGEALIMGGWDPQDHEHEVPDRLWRTLVANRGPNGTSVPGWYRRTCLECLQSTDRVGDLDIESLKKKTSTPSTMITFLERVQQIVWGRRFFITRGNPDRSLDEYFGLGSSDIRKGDVVCILFGCSVPVVLRKLPKNVGGYYEFIGECYVHGAMDGEAIQGPALKWPYNEKKDKKITTFRLI